MRRRWQASSGKARCGGQALVLACVMMLVLCAAVLATVHLGHTLHARIRLQNSADAAAYSAAWAAFACFQLCSTGSTSLAYSFSPFSARSYGVPPKRNDVASSKSPTMARREPTIRLKRVDLPTFGRPTMAIVGIASSKGNFCGVL